MRRAGLLALALLGLASSGCRGEAEAQPQVVAKVDVEAKPAAKPATAELKLAIPASWRPLPDASHAMEEALSGAMAGAKLTAVTVAAWGDPARGCYALQLSAKEQGVRLAEVAAGLRKGFGVATATGSGSALAGASAAPPANAGSAELQFEVKPPLAGTVRARLRDDGASTRLAAAACFFHPRYPEQCKRHCERVLASLEAP
jgi:hypothetical protein